MNHTKIPDKKPDRNTCLLPRSRAFIMPTILVFDSSAYIQAKLPQSPAKVLNCNGFLAIDSKSGGDVVHR